MGWNRASRWRLEISSSPARLWGAGDGDIGAVILRQNLAVLRVRAGGHDVGLGAQRGEGLGGGVAVARSQGRGAILADDFRQGREIAHHGMAKGERIVNAKCHTCHRQGSTAGEHEDPHQFAADGRFTKGLHLDPLHFSALEPPGLTRGSSAQPAKLGAHVAPPQGATAGTSATHANKRAGTQAGKDTHAPPEFGP